MNINKLDPGAKAPKEINVIIEIPAQSQPVKYEVDKASGALFVDRFMATSMYYPCNYGYIPKTLSEDNDPADVLVLTPFPLLSGSVIRCRPVGLLKMTDEAGSDNKLLAVPINAMTDIYDDIKSPDDVPVALLHSISHFFDHYKDLEPNKWVDIAGWEGVKAAQKEITESIKRYSGN